MTAAFHSLKTLMERRSVAERLSPVFLTPRFQRSGHVVALFVSNDQELRYVVKIPRAREFESRLLREAFNLNRACKLGINGIPQLIGLENHGGTIALVETAVPGIPIDAEFARTNAVAADRCVSRWLIDLHNASSVHGENLSEWGSSLCLEPLDALRDHIEDDSIGRAREILSVLKHSDLPLPLVHGDMSAPNLLLQSDSRCGVIDWEFARQPGLPLSDYIFFLAFILTAQGAAPDAVIDSLLNGWGAERTAEMASALQIPRQLIPALALATWTAYLAEMVSHVNAARTESVTRYLMGSRPLAYWTSTIRAISRA
jgi:aminoglycoside phosphotransferase